MPKKQKIKKFDEGGGILSKYDKFSEEYPLAKLTADLMPGAGVATSIADVASGVNKEQYGKAAIDALGVIPGVKTIKTLAKGLQKAKEVKKYSGPLWETARNLDRGADIAEAQAKQDKLTAEKKKQENVTPSMGKKKGGIVRGHGCEKRGKTIGRFV